MPDAKFIPVKLKLDYSGIGAEAAAAAKEAAEAFKKAFEGLGKDFDTTKIINQENFKKAFDQISEEGKKTAKELTEAFSKVTPERAEFGGFRAPPTVPTQRPPREDDRFERRLEAANTAFESFAKLVEGANPLLIAAPFLSLLGRALMGGPAQRSEAEAGQYARRLARYGMGGGAAGVAGLVEDIGATGVFGGGEVAARGAGRAAQAGVAGLTAADLGGRLRAVQAERAALAVERAAPTAAAVIPAAAEAEEGLGSKALKGALAGSAVGTMIEPGVGTGVGAAIGAGLTVVGGLAWGATTAANAVKDLGLRLAETRERTEHLAKTLYPGMESEKAVEELTKLTRSLGKTGLEIESLQRGFSGLAVDITKRMPEIAREYERSSDDMTEANLKVEESQRNVTKASLARDEANDEVIKSTGRLALLEDTGAERRQEQIQQAQLGVSGAKVGAWGAQMAQEAAAINLRYAPREQKIADVQGPETVAGAKLGVSGALLAYREAVATRLPGQEPNLQTEIRLANERRNQAIAVTAHNYREAVINARRAIYVDEPKRKEMEAAGLGPTGQATQARDTAEQAAKQAGLRVQTAETQLKTVENDQQYNTLQMQRNTAIRNLTSAYLNQAEGQQKFTESQIGLRRAQDALAGEHEQNIKEIQKTLRGEPGGPGLQHAPPERLRDALILQARERVKKERGPEAEPRAGDVIDDIIKAIQLKPEDQPRGQAIVQAGLPGLRSRTAAGMEAVNKFLARVKELKPGIPASEQLGPEDLARVEQLMGGYRRATAAEDRARARGGEGVIETEATAEFMSNVKDMNISVGEFTKSTTKFNEMMAGFAKSIEQAIVGDRDEETPLGPPTKPEQPTPPGDPERAQRIMRARARGRYIPDESELVPTIQPSEGGLTGAPREGGLIGAITGTADAIKGTAPQIEGAGSAVAGALSGVAEKIGAVQIPSAAGKAQPASAAPTPAETPAELTPAQQVQERFPKASGGLITGPGTATSDSIPIFASNGEYIIRQSSVARYGTPFLDALNNRRVGFAAGGLVGPAPETGGGDKPVLVQVVGGVEVKGGYTPIPVELSKYSPYLMSQVVAAPPLSNLPATPTPLTPRRRPTTEQGPGPWPGPVSLPWPLPLPRWPMPKGTPEETPEEQDEVLRREFARNRRWEGSDTTAAGQIEDRRFGKTIYYPSIPPADPLPPSPVTPGSPGSLAEDAGIKNVGRNLGRLFQPARAAKLLEKQEPPQTTAASTINDVFKELGIGGKKGGGVQAANLSGYSLEDLISFIQPSGDIIPGKRGHTGVKVVRIPGPPDPWQEDPVPQPKPRPEQAPAQDITDAAKADAAKVLTARPLTATLSGGHVTVDNLPQGGGAGGQKLQRLVGDDTGASGGGASGGGRSLAGLTLRQAEAAIAEAMPVGDMSQKEWNAYKETGVQPPPQWAIEAGESLGGEEKGAAETRELGRLSTVTVAGGHITVDNLPTGGGGRGAGRDVDGASGGGASGGGASGGGKGGLGSLTLRQAEAAIALSLPVGDMSQKEWSDYKEKGVKPVPGWAIEAARNLSPEGDIRGRGGGGGLGGGEGGGGSTTVTVAGGHISVDNFPSGGGGVSGGGGGGGGGEWANASTGLKAAVIADTPPGSGDAVYPDPDTTTELIPEMEQWLGRASGGSIRLASGGLVPARVSNGEYRMSPEAVSHYGVGLFDRLNGGGFVRLQGGGSVGRPALSDEKELLEAWTKINGTAPDPAMWRAVIDKGLNPLEVLGKNAPWGKWTPLIRHLENRARQLGEGAYAAGKDIVTAIPNLADLMRRSYAGEIDYDNPQVLAQVSREVFKNVASLATVQPAVGLEKGALGVFGGVGAKTANLEKLKIAELMEKAGASAADIWKAAGWARGADGKWRFEIFDKPARLNPQIYGPKASDPVSGTVDLMTQEKMRHEMGWGYSRYALSKEMKAPLGEHLQHEELYKAYPGLFDIKTTTKDVPGIGGSYRQRPEKITAEAQEQALPTLSTLLHEVQHAIQRKEGFSKGTSAINPAYQEAAGEVEARNVQTRLTRAHGGEDLTETLPTATEDVPRSKQVLKPPREGGAFASGGSIRLAEGGLVSARVSNGEYRMSPEAVSHYGVGLFDQINGRGLAAGGPVFSRVPRPAGFPAGFSPTPEPGLIGRIASAIAAQRGHGFPSFSMGNISGVDPRSFNVFAGQQALARETAAVHQLNLVTSAGTFAVQTSAETLAAIQSSALGARLTSTGNRPSWY